MTCGHDDSAHTGPANQGQAGTLGEGEGKRETRRGRWTDGANKWKRTVHVRPMVRCSSGRSRFPANDACLLACPTSISDSSPFPLQHFRASISHFEIASPPSFFPTFHKSRSFSSPLDKFGNQCNIIITRVSYAKLRIHILCRNDNSP